MSDYASMAFFPFHKKWRRLPEYEDAGMLTRAIVDGALYVFMDRGSLPSSADALRRAIGAGEAEFSQCYDEASVAIEILLPQWAEALDEAWARVYSVRERNRKIARTRKRRDASSTSGDTNGETDGSTTGEPLVDQPGTIVKEKESKEKKTEIAKAISPKPRRSARDSGGIPEGFDSFFSEFKNRYPKRPGQPWSEGKKAMLAAMVRHPELDRQAVLDAAAAYAELMASTGKAGTDKVCHASTWLNQDRWDCDFTMAPVGGGGWDDESVF